MTISFVLRTSPRPHSLTGALVLEDCQVDNENAVTWEGLSYFGKWWKVISLPFPRLDVLFSCQSPIFVLVTHYLIWSDSSDKWFLSIMWQFILSKLVTSPTDFSTSFHQYIWCPQSTTKTRWEMREYGWKHWYPEKLSLLCSLRITAASSSDF